MGNREEEKDRRTRLVALCSVHNDSFESTRSPSEKGRELPFEIAEATADLRKSIMSISTWFCKNGQVRPRVVVGCREMVEEDQGTQQMARISAPMLSRMMPRSLLFLSSSQRRTVTFNKGANERQNGQVRPTDSRHT
jgi:hypothetical protein